MKCPSCGKDVPDSIYCINCKAKLPEFKEEEDEVVKETVEDA